MLRGVNERQKSEDSLRNAQKGAALSNAHCPFRKLWNRPGTIWRFNLENAKLKIVNSKLNLQTVKNPQIIWQIQPTHPASLRLGWKQNFYDQKLKGAKVEGRNDEVSLRQAIVADSISLIVNHGTIFGSEKHTMEMHARYQAMHLAACSSDSSSNWEEFRKEEETSFFGRSEVGERASKVERCQNAPKTRKQEGNSL